MSGTRVDLCQPHTQTTHTHIHMASSTSNTNWMNILADDGRLKTRLEEMLSKLPSGEG